MQGELTQAIRTLTKAVDVLVHLGYTLAGLCVFMLVGIIGFLVAWHLRQDKKISDNRLQAAANTKTCAENERMIGKNFPELFDKWDRIADAIILGSIEKLARKGEEKDGEVQG